MFQNTLTLLVQAITKDGGLSADYSLNIVIGVCGILVTALLTFVFNNLNNNIKHLSDGFTKFQEDFHKFVEAQGILNERFNERTKDL
jgi:hypothetical protein